ncbi:MAG TPA: hypothetical protein VLH08_14930 [Acidobacteriota bacterium]|nr:hypothetical protein [Acidobacteriota bacterium]
MPVFQSWEFLPEGGIWRIVKLAIAAAVALIAVFTTTKIRLHAAAIAFLIGLGILFFCLNQGIIKEPVNATDLQILTTAKKLISDESEWDRTASLECSPQAHQFSLYCALRKASIEEAGNFRHRRPALQIVRTEIEKDKPQARYEHRLAGFNSDPNIKFSDLQRVLDLAIIQAKSQLQK